MVDRSHLTGWMPQAYEPLRKLGEKVADWFAPRADAAVMEDAYEVALELPGVAASDIDISVQDETLSVRGEKRFEREEEGRSYFFSEREYGAFQRSFRLPPDANKDRIDAAFKNGVLAIRIAKIRSSAPEVRKVPIRGE